MVENNHRAGVEDLQHLKAILLIITAKLFVQALAVRNANIGKVYPTQFAGRALLR
jgi:hypothetical protein